MTEPQGNLIIAILLALFLVKCTENLFPRVTFKWRTQMNSKHTLTRDYQPSE